MPLSSPGGYRKRDDVTGRQFGGGGGSRRICDEIRFAIETVEVPDTDEPVRALCQIHAVPYGFTRENVPGRILTAPDGSGGVVYVYDAVGCFFAEPTGDLVGRFGYARYMVPVDDDYGEPRFEVHSLCCDEPGCT